jgi:hypothetical protein
MVMRLTSDFSTEVTEVRRRNGEFGQNRRWPRKRILTQRRSARREERNRFLGHPLGMTNWESFSKHSEHKRDEAGSAAHVLAVGLA